MEWKYRNITLDQLDEKFSNLGSLYGLSRPQKGWIKSIREAFGMTVKQLGVRANNMLPQGISQLEKQEIYGSTTIKTMENVAQALNCKFVYAIVPENSFREIVMEQAKKTARKKVSYISHSMKLEDQSLTNQEIEKQIEELAIELLRTKPKQIWEEQNI